MINTGSFDRDSFRFDLAEVISKVGQYRPKVIGVDHDFSNDTSIYGTQELRHALSLLSNKVILGRDSRKNKNDVLEFDSSIYGIVDFPDVEGQISVRRYSGSANSFANQMLLLGSSLKSEKSVEHQLGEEGDGNSDFGINYIDNHDGNG